MTHYGNELLVTAEEYLLKHSANSEEFAAALEHIIWLAKNPEDRLAAKAAFKRVVTARGHERQFRDKLKGVSL